MERNTTKESSAAISTGHQTFWQRLTRNGRLFRLSTVWKIVVGLVIFGILMAITLVLYNNVSIDGKIGVAIDFPKEWGFGAQVMKWIDNIVDWVVINWDPFFSAVNVIILRGILVPLERFFLWLPWWSILVITGLLAWQTVNVKFAAMAVIFLLLMSFAGLLDLASMTLAITLTAALICVIFGLPLGIIAAKSNRFDGIIRPILDMMQTMPSFVYLIPALMLFGLGKVPAVMATCIYAIPPIIRLTTLGIRQVDTSVVEAAKSFGATSWQLLYKIQFPLALPTILAGLNQTVMMALAMVVIASMIGARGLGTEVLTGIGRIEVGRGVLAGLGIVFMAIILDRISQGFGRRPQAKRVI